MTVSLSKILFYCVQTGPSQYWWHWSPHQCFLSELLWTVFHSNLHFLSVFLPIMLSSPLLFSSLSVGGWGIIWLKLLKYLSRRSWCLSSCLIRSTSTFLSRLLGDSARTEWFLMIHTYTRFTCGCTGHGCTLSEHCTGHPLTGTTPW